MAKKQQQRPDVPRPELQNTSNVDTDVFVKGMSKDMDVALTSKENWTHAVNAINNSAKGDSGTIGNEPGNIQCGSIPYTVIGTIHLYGDKWAIFTTDDISSEIGIFDDSQCKYEVVVNDPCLNFDRRYTITGASKESFECQWWVYWDDGINPSRALNLDDVPWTQDEGTQEGDCIIYNDAIPRTLDCERIRLSPLINIPCIKLSKAKDGGQLQNGSYEAYIAYVIDDNKVTDYFKSNIQSLWDHQDNAGSLDIDIEGLDKQFESYQLVIYTNAGMNPYAVVVGTYSTEQTHINLDMIDMSASTAGLVDQLPLYTPVFEKSEKMYSVNDYLLRQAPTTDFDFNYQCKANNIEVRWVSTQYPADYYVKGGNKPTFMRDEQYSFFIRFVYNTGNKSSSYHIPGRQPTAVDTGPPPDLTQALTDEAGFQNWQVNNTATQTMAIDAGGGENIGSTTDDGGLIVAKGLMGYWESTERYPNNSTVWCDLCNTNIRHHKMPEENTSIWTQRNTPDSQWIFVLGVDFDNIEWPTRIREDGVEVAIPNIVGYEILVGSRQGNKSIIAKGLARNMRRYNIQSAQGVRGTADAESTGGNLQGLLPNYPFNDLQRDPYLCQQEVIRQSDYTGNEYDASFTTHNIFTFHSPDTSFDRPFLNPSEIKSYGVAGGYSLGRFKRSEDHPKHKLIRDIAALIAAVIGAGYAIMEMRGEKVQKTKGTAALSIGKDPGPYAQSDSYQDNSTITTTAGTATAGFFTATATGGTANVNMQVSDDTGVPPPAGSGGAPDGIHNEDVQQISPVGPTGAANISTAVTVDGGGAAPGMVGNLQVNNAVGGLIPGTGLDDPTTYQITYNPGVSQSQINATENVQQLSNAQSGGPTIANPLQVSGQDQTSGQVSSSGFSLFSGGGVDINDITAAFQPTQEGTFAMSTTPIGDGTNLIINGTLPNSISGAEEDFLSDIKTKNENAAMQAPGYMGPSRDVEMKGTKYKSLPGFLQIMFKTYSFLNFMVEGGEGIIEMIYEFMNPQDYAYKYNSYGLYSGNFNTSDFAGNRYRADSVRSRYISSAFQNLGTNFKINNLHRPKTVVLETSQDLHDPTNVWADNSKFVLGELPQWIMQNPTTPITAQISAHYVGLKYRIDNQYGQIQGIRQIPVNCVSNFKDAVIPSDVLTGEPEPNTIMCTNCDDRVFEQENRFRSEVVFGGDAFINRYSEKVIMPFFWDFLKGEPDGYTFDYRLHQNVPFVRFWYNSQRYELSGLVRPLTDLSFQWLSNPNDPGLPSALHNLDRLGSGTYAPDDEPGVFTGFPMNEDEWVSAQNEGTSGVSSLGTGTGWTSGTTGGTSYTGTTDTSGTTSSQANSNWTSSSGQATKSNGIFTIKNAFCYLHSSGINEFFVESELNMAQRDWDDKPEGRHYDWQEFTDVNALFHADIIKDGNFYKFDRSLMWKNLGSQLLSYGFVQPLSYDPTIAAECMTHYPKRIMYSLQAQNEAKKDFWRIFLPNNKEDWKEPVTTIKAINKTGAMILFPHRAPQMWQGVDTLQTEGNIKVTIGDGGLFAGPRQNITNADLPHEYASCESMRSVINTPSGAYFISQAQGKIFNYTGGLENIADRGMKQWFNTYLPSRLLQDFPEMEGQVDADNPVMGIGTQSVYDPNYDLVYFMKKDYQLIDDSGCVIYDPDFGFGVNLTECEGLEQVQECPDGFTLYEAGQIHPSTGEVLTEDTCCNIVSETFQEFADADFDCGLVTIITPFEGFESLPVGTNTQTKDIKNTVVFEIGNDVFDVIKNHDPKKIKLNFPFLDDDRLVVELNKFSPYKKSFKLLKKTKDGTKRIPYVSKIKTYKIKGFKNGAKVSGTVIVKDNVLRASIHMPGKEYEVKVIDKNSKYALWDRENALVKGRPFECDIETLDEEQKSGVRTAVENAMSVQRMSDNNVCIKLAILIPYGFLNGPSEDQDGFDGDEQAVTDYTMAIVAGISEIYNVDLGVTEVIVNSIYIYGDAESCPFEDLSLTTNAYLPATTSEFSSNPDLDVSVMPRDVMFTFDARLGGGRAYIRSLCRSTSSAMVAGNAGWGLGTQVDEDNPLEWVNNFNSLMIKVVAHELGHICGANHTHSCDLIENGQLIENLFPGNNPSWDADGSVNFAGGQIDICGTTYFGALNSGLSFSDFSYDAINNAVTAPDEPCWNSSYNNTPILDNLFANIYEDGTFFTFGTIMSYCQNLTNGIDDFDIPTGLQFNPIVKSQALLPWIADTKTAIVENQSVSSIYNLYIDPAVRYENCLACSEDPIEVSCGSNDNMQDWIDQNINYVWETGYIYEVGGPPLNLSTYCGWCNNGTSGTSIVDNFLNDFQGASDYCVCCSEVTPCNNEIYLVLDSGDYVATFGFTIAQLISYIVTGDSGNYSTSFNLIGFYENNPIATVNLPSFAGINTGTWGVNNLNDILSWFVPNQDCNLELVIPQDLQDFGTFNGTVFWSETGPPPVDNSDWNVSQLTDMTADPMVTMCTAIQSCDPTIIEPNENGNGNGTDVYGCTDPTALNYDSLATLDNGSCIYEGDNNEDDIYGCTDPLADNYDAFATVDDGSCLYDGDTTDDVYGCTDPTAINYNSLATIDNGSCRYNNGDTRIACYRCLNGSPVGQMFPGPDCPSGWTTDDTPCPTWSESNCECWCEDGFNLVFTDTLLPAVSPDDCNVTQTAITREVRIVTSGAVDGEYNSSNPFMANGTFEGTPGWGLTPPPWNDGYQCSPGSANMSPDTHDGSGTFFPIITLPPYEGNSYIGLLESSNCNNSCVNAGGSSGYDPEIVPISDCYNCYYQELVWQQLQDGEGGAINLSAGALYEGSVALTTFSSHNSNPGGTTYAAQRIYPRLEIWGGSEPPGRQGQNYRGPQYNDCDNGPPCYEQYTNGQYLGGGYDGCNQPGFGEDELLWNSGPVEEVDDWTVYDYSFIPNGNWEYIVLKIQTVDADNNPICMQGYYDPYELSNFDCDNAGRYLGVDGFVSPTSTGVRRCQCPEGFSMVLDDGIYQTPVSPENCMKEYENPTYFNLTDEFDVICVKFENEIGNVTCLNETTVVEGSCVDPTLTDVIVPIELTDETYFKDISWTVSYDPKIKGWISFHDWHPELTLSSLNHFMTTKSKTTDSPICPPGFEFDETEQSCCQSLQSNSPAIVSLEYGEFDYTEGGWGEPGGEFEDGAATFVTNPDFECPGGGFGCVGWGVTPAPWENGMMGQGLGPGDCPPDDDCSDNSSPCLTCDECVDCYKYFCPILSSEPGYTPDTLPIVANGVTFPANSGDTYVGFVHSCDIDSACGGNCQTCWWQEGASQELLDANGDPTTLNANEDYTGSLYITQLSQVAQMCPNNGSPGVGVAAQIELWGGDEKPANQGENYRGSQFGYDGNNAAGFGDDELLWASGAIYNIDDWQEYVYNFSPTQNWKWIFLKIQMLEFDHVTPGTECNCKVYLAIDSFEPPRQEYIDPVCECEDGFTMVDISGMPTDICREDNECVRVACECPEAQGEFQYQEGDCDTLEEYLGLDTNPNPLTCFFDGLSCVPASYIEGGIWRHNVRCDLFSNYYNIQYGWGVELVESVGQTVNILRNVEYEMEAYQYKSPFNIASEAGSGEPPYDNVPPGWTSAEDYAVDCQHRYHVLDWNFNWAYIYNTEQVSGNLHLNLKPKNNAPEINNFPQIIEDANDPRNSRYEILFDKVEQKYRFNMFWDSTDNRGEIITPVGDFDSNAFISQLPPVLTDLDGYDQWLNPDNIDYNKDPLQRKKFRHYWNKIYLERRPVPFADADDEWQWYDKYGNAVEPEPVKMLLKLDNAKINVSFR